MLLLGQFPKQQKRRTIRNDIVQEILAIVRQVANGLPSDQPDSLDDGLPGG